MVSKGDRIYDEELKIRTSRPGNSNTLQTPGARNQPLKKSNQPILDTREKLKRIDNILANNKGKTVTHSSKCEHQATNGRSSRSRDDSNSPSVADKTTTNKKKSVSTSLSGEGSDLSREKMKNKSDRRKTDTMRTDEVALMSDAQLRTALLQHGFQNTPITDSTRRVLKNKLKLLLSNTTHLYVFFRNDSTVVDIKCSSNPMNPRSHVTTEAGRGAARCEPNVTHSLCKVCAKQCDGDNSTLKKSERKCQKLAALSSEPDCQGTCSSKTKRGSKRGPVISSMQHQMIRYSGRSQHGLWDFQLTSTHGYTIDGNLDFDEPFEVVMNRLLGNSYRLSGFPFSYL